MHGTPRGLPPAEAAELLEKHGPNVIFTPSTVTFFDILVEELREPMILLLLAVGVLYSVLGNAQDALTIFSVILLLALAEVQNEYRAKKAVQRLSEIASPLARIVRNGEIVSIEATGVVPADVLVFSSGTKVPADARVLSAIGLEIDESSITGESYPAAKAEGDEVSAGTVVVSGEGFAEVTATGRATRLGALAEGLKTVRPPKTPLQKAMKELSAKLVWVAVFFSVAIPLIGLVRGQSLKDMILVGLSLSFATIPEEMPIIITMVLGLGSYRLSKKAFLVKRLAAAESMGAVNVIVTDKTGTLTESRMTLTSISSSLPDAGAVGVALGALSEVDATPVDVALRARAAEIGVPLDARQVVRKRELGDGSKTRAVLRDDGTLTLSGAPEQVFAMCASVPGEIRDRMETDAANGVRLIAVARAIVPQGSRDADWMLLQRELEFVALLGFTDPARAEVPGAIAEAARAGVRTIMVTGDHPATAVAIARQVGILGGDEDADGLVVTGDALDRMSDDALLDAVTTARVFARTTPDHKYRIVEALQRSGLHVAVTGDGINDALAIKAADVGIAMGIRGTDVAKEAADVILADDNYATITNAIFEGRTFYDNLRKGVKYYLSVKVALIAVFLLPAVFGVPMPFSPVQIILLELFMDLAASAGFVGEPAEPDIHVRRPETMKTDILDAPQRRDLFLKGFFLFAAVTGAYVYAGAMGMTVAAQQSLSFAAWMIGHVALAFVSRSDREPLARVGIFSNSIVNLWALATALFLAVGLYVPAIGTHIRLVPVPLGTLLTMALVEVGWMSLLELRKRPRTQARESVPGTGR